jgi:flagellar biogenesis protein FliO
MEFVIGSKHKSRSLIIIIACMWLQLLPRGRVLQYFSRLVLVEWNSVGSNESVVPVGVNRGEEDIGGM